MNSVYLLIFCVTHVSVAIPANLRTIQVNQNLFIDLRNEDPPLPIQNILGLFSEKNYLLPGRAYNPVMAFRNAHLQPNVDSGILSDISDTKYVDTRKSSSNLDCISNGVDKKPRSNARNRRAVTTNDTPSTDDTDEGGDDDDDMKLKSNLLEVGDPLPALNLSVGR